MAEVPSEVMTAEPVSSSPPKAKVPEKRYRVGSVPSEFGTTEQRYLRAFSVWEYVSTIRIGRSASAPERERSVIWAISLCTALSGEKSKQYEKEGENPETKDSSFLESK